MLYYLGCIQSDSIGRGPTACLVLAGALTGFSAACCAPRGAGVHAAMAMATATASIGLYRCCKGPAGAVPVHAASIPAAAAAAGVCCSAECALAAFGVPARPGGATRVMDG